MKIIQAAKSVTKMSSEELEYIVSSSDDMSQIYAAIQEAYNRNILNVFYEVCLNPQILSDKKILNYTINFMDKMTLPLPIDFLNMFMGVLEAAKGSNEFNNKITAISLKSPWTSAIALLDKNTPNETVNLITNKNRLNIPSQAAHNNAIFEMMIELTSHTNLSWNNDTSAMVLLTRIFQSPMDKFIDVMSKQNMGITVASIFLGASKQIGNSKLRKNLEDNQSQGAKLAVGMEKIAEKGINKNNIDVVLDTLQYASSEHIKEIWAYIEISVSNRNDNDALLPELIFNYVGRGNKSISDLIVEKDPSMIITLIDFAVKNSNDSNIKSSPSFSKLIHIGLQNPSTKETILQLPQEWFKFIMMTPENREIVKEHFDPTSKEEEMERSNLEDLIGKGNEWHKKYSSANTK